MCHNIDQSDQSLRPPTADQNATQVHTLNACTVEPRYKEVGYNKTLSQQGNPAGRTRTVSLLSSLPFYPDPMRNSTQQGNPHGPQDLIIKRLHRTT